MRVPGVGPDIGAFQYGGAAPVDGGLASADDGGIEPTMADSGTASSEDGGVASGVDASVSTTGDAGARRGPNGQAAPSSSGCSCSQAGTGSRGASPKGTTWLAIAVGWVAVSRSRSTRARARTSV